MHLCRVCLLSYKLTESPPRAGAHVWTKDRQPRILLMLFSGQRLPPPSPAGSEASLPQRPLVIIRVWMLTEVVSHEGPVAQHPWGPGAHRRPRPVPALPQSDLRLTWPCPEAVMFLCQGRVTGSLVLGKEAGRAGLEWRKG